MKDTITAIKKALEGVTHAPGKWESEGTAVYCDDATGQRVCDTKGDLLFWSEDQKRNVAAYIAATNPVAMSDLLSTLESLQRENEELRAMFTYLNENSALELVWQEVNGDPSECGWHLFRRFGGRSDRDFKVVGTGETVEQAITLAMEGTHE